uniref:Uncharacterized protein n=1 Tax=Acanthochromis polyacanthus TaxID=80966 RepID=A0A3Q1FI28_9TELE
KENQIISKKKEEENCENFLSVYLYATFVQVFCILINTVFCWIHRSDADIVPQGATVQSVGVERSKVLDEDRAPLLKIIPFRSEDKHLDLDALKHSMAAKLRPRRAPQRGCQFGTCQVHNLANTLYHIGKANGKEESKKANDPQGYGR